MTRRAVLTVVPALALFPVCSRAGDSPPVAATVASESGAVHVTVDGAPFTTLRYTGHAKPVLFPVIGPGGISMTRNWPIAEAAPGEEKDHPHHTSLWFTHGSLNGVDFWSEKPDSGKIVVQGTPDVTSGSQAVVIRSRELWQTADGKPVCSSATTLRCGLDGSDRFIDYTIRIEATHGSVTFGDTKEGTMGLRSHPALNLTGKVARGKARNSEGQTGRDIWGKKARWVDYSGPVDGRVVGIACFDHPSNLRHPTTWHARDYGLIAANPFGLHDFDRAANPPGTGNHVIPEGGSLELRYRWLFHEGEPDDADLNRRWKAWAEQSR